GVDCHMARVARPPTLLVPEIPAPVSDLVMKLLAKEPQDRYQSGHGLHYDLDRCLRQMESGQVSPFALAKRDVSDRSVSPAARLGTDAEQLDFLAIVKASQAISGQIVLEQLLDTLMRVVLENAGAQKGCLLLTQKEAIAPVAEACVDGPHVNVRVFRENGIPEAPVPLSVLNYVRRTWERVILDNACEPNSFSEDEYFLRDCPKSLLCLPIIRQAALVGLLYLENSLVARAFTADRLAVLELLASQAAISLENARLYSDLQRENAERKQGEMALRD